MDVAGKKVLVMGLGRFGGGVGTCKYLVSQKAHVTVTDKCDAASLDESLKQLENLPIALHLGGHNEQDFQQADLIIANPAVPYQSPWLAWAREHHKPITTEMNLFFQQCPTPNIIGITGSNGKSTTTSMIYHILCQAANQKHINGRVWLGGNIGIGDTLLDHINEIHPCDYVVVELSSFQLYHLGSIAKSPHIAVVTNISANHLDWHGTMEHYIASKQNIVRFQKSSDFAVFNGQDDELNSWQKVTVANMAFYNPHDVEDISLQVPGRHNQSNAAAALAVGRHLNLHDDLISQALGTYHSLPHRLELVRTLDGVHYYNDSIATTPESAIAAIKAFAQEKVMILGGYDKKIPFDGLIAACENGVSTVILIGQVKDTLRKQFDLNKTRKGHKLPTCFFAQTLEQAVYLAKEHAPPGSVVLLSPACASYDMFTNFQQRGEQFKALVQAL